MTIDLSLVRAFLDESHHTLGQNASEWAAERIATLPPEHEDAAARTQSRQLVSLFGERDWLSHAMPRTDLRSCVMLREVFAYHSPLADSVFALQCLGSMPLVLAGSDELKERWLTSVLSGEAMAAFAMTEPEAGSDVASMRTRAVQDGDYFVLNGEKHLITNAGVADFYSVFASTNPDAGSRGLSCFLVPADTPGLVFDKAQVLSEPHPLGRLRFRDCRVHRRQLLGQVGKGFHLGMATLDRLRPTVAGAACGMAQRALDEAVHYARTRRQFGKRLADQPIIQSKLAEMAIQLSAARLLVYRSAWEKDQGAERITSAAAMGKAFATEAAQRVIDQAVQIHGGRGVLMDATVDRLYRAIRPLRIYEGATEVQHLIVAKELLKAADMAGEG